MNAQMERNFAFIRKDEGMAARLARYMQRLVNQMKREKADPTLMSKEEFFAKVDEALAQHERGEGVVLHSHEEIDEFFEQLRADALQN